jgi:antitoxin component of MazEF toxin-antitoxin module
MAIVARGKIVDGKIEIPSSILEKTLLREGSEVEIEVIDKDTIQIDLAREDEEKVIERRKLRSREALENFMKDVGFKPTDNPDIWSREERRTTAQKELIGTVYEIRINIPDLLQDDKKLRGFVKRYKKYLEEEKK